MSHSLKMSHIILHKEPSSRYLYSLHLSILFLLPLLLLAFMFVGTIGLSFLFQSLLMLSHWYLLSHISCFPHPPRRLQILLLRPPRTLIFPLPFVTISALALIILTLFPLIICLPLKHFLCQSHLLLFPSYTRKLSLTLAGVRQWSMEVEMHALN